MRLFVIRRGDQYQGKLRESWVRWFGHVQMRDRNVPVRRCDNFAIKSVRQGIGRLKKSWKVVIRHEIVLSDIIEGMTLNRPQWKALSEMKETQSVLVKTVGHRIFFLILFHLFSPVACYFFFLLQLIVSSVFCFILCLSLVYLYNFIESFENIFSTQLEK